MPVCYHCTLPEPFDMVLRVFAWGSTLALTSLGLSIKGRCQSVVACVCNHLPSFEVKIKCHGQGQRSKSKVKVKCLAHFVTLPCFGVKVERSRSRPRSTSTSRSTSKLPSRPKVKGQGQCQGQRSKSRSEVKGQRQGEKDFRISASDLHIFRVLVSVVLPASCYPFSSESEHTWTLCNTPRYCATLCNSKFSVTWSPWFLVYLLASTMLKGRAVNFCLQNSKPKGRIGIFTWRFTLPIKVEVIGANNQSKYSIWWCKIYTN